MSPGGGRKVSFGIYRIRVLYSSQHNLDVVHIEKNVFDNVLNTIMNVKGKKKETIKSHKELNMICASRKYPKAAYMLDIDDR